MIRNALIIIGIAFFCFFALVAYAIITASGERIAEQRPQTVTDTTRSGEIGEDEIWSGEIFVTGDIFVEKNATLTIMPGTIVTVAAFSDDQRGNKWKSFSC